MPQPAAAWQVATVAPSFAQVHENVPFSSGTQWSAYSSPPQ